MTANTYKRRLANHVKLCRKNLKSNRVKCCATCPFEDFIVASYPDTEVLFKAKRKFLNDTKDIRSLACSGLTKAEREVILQRGLKGCCV
jgi:hypothetical protein